MGNELSRVERFDEAIRIVHDAALHLGVRFCEVRYQIISLDDSHHVALPLLGAQGWFATLVCGVDEEFSPTMERELALIATYLSVWCTERGIGIAPSDEVRLTRRQHDVALRAARGDTNAEIAQDLAISINTVKVRLKQAFERLYVDNRTELANVLRTCTAAPPAKALSRPRRRA